MIIKKAPDKNREPKLIRQKQVKRGKAAKRQRASPARRSLRYGRRLDKQDISVFLGKSYYYAVGAV